VNDSAEYLVLANVPHDPEAAKRMQLRVANGDVVVHPSYEKEILTKLEDAVAGRLAVPDHENETNLSLNLDFNESNLSKTIKSLSVAELEDVLLEFFERKCKADVAVNIGQFSQKASARSENQEFEISLSFKIASRIADKE